MEIDVLGTKYLIIKESEPLIREDRDGSCDFYCKVINVRETKDMLPDVENISIKVCRVMEALRHEIVHAFMHESGLGEYCMDEVLVDWIAMQFPKMLKAMQEVHALEAPQGVIKNGKLPQDD